MVSFPTLPYVVAQYMTYAQKQKTKSRWLLNNRANDVDLQVGKLHLQL